MLKPLKWPAIFLLLGGITHILSVAAMPAFDQIITLSVVAPILVAFGAAGGYRVAISGGTLVHVLIGGVLLGLIAMVVDTIGFGMILGRGMQMGMVGGIVGFLIIFWGVLVGAAFGMKE